MKKILKELESIKKDQEFLIYLLGFHLESQERDHIAKEICKLEQRKYQILSLLSLSSSEEE